MNNEYYYYMNKDSDLERINKYMIIKIIIIIILKEIIIKTIIITII